ncbi:MAG: glucose-6-phosphate isomerase [SAR86 cluster bacterium]|uniref:Glucose-6-phosphate isomerase n=1 Tax=SAR86 cluster bacterium TaxID=2030880 RepID=A0A2A4X2U3_9GAMM|nr:MAG: glucose-6-phosphate isomerase [SAR86 cluster bacterium]
MDGSRNNAARLALQKHSEEFRRREFRLSALFDTDGNRFQAYSLSHEGLLLDYSKNFIEPETISLLLDLTEQSQLPAAIDAMFRGEEINITEKRAALHVALRDPSAKTNTPEVSASLDRMASLVAELHGGKWTGYSGKAITDVVNIGIGGSDLGPAMVCDALSPFATNKLSVHFVSNVDPSHLQSTLKDLEAETTLFVVASKSFSTLETLKNAEAARDWLLQQTDATATAKHFIAITTNLSAATEFGIEEANLYPLWDWVGGRFSLWSAIGLPIALALGMDGFRQLLAGAHSMDEHFRTAPPEKNLPVILALLNFWYREYFDAHSTAIVPYSQRLNLLPSFLQQLCMESLGKSVDKQGVPIEHNTGDIIWGSAGTNGQHSYFQLLHQGTEFIPVDFIAFANSDAEENAQAHQHLLANCFSQSLALMEGKLDADSSHKVVAGNKPSNTLLLEELNPYNLGMLIALFEHKVYALSVLWNINAFDQWGVELGKKLSTKVFAAMSAEPDQGVLDESTQGLIQKAQHWRKD